MMYWNGDMGVWGFIMMALSFVLFWGAVVTAIILFTRSMSHGNRGYDRRVGNGSAESILAERFARGEIDETEYASRLAALRRGSGR